MFLERNPKCQCEEMFCTREATDVHHKRGRVGENMWNDWLAVCRSCHSYIEDNPKWALRHGFSLPREKRKE